MRVSPPHWYTPPRAGKQTTPYLYRRSHTYTGQACLKPPSRRLSIQGHPSRKPSALIPLARRIRGGKPGKSHKNETRVNPYKRMTPPPTQNLKALGLWVFFLIYCSTFSFLPNVGLRLTLEYLRISMIKTISFQGKHT